MEAEASTNNIREVLLTNIIFILQVVLDKLELFVNGSWGMKIRRVVDVGLTRIPVLWAFQEILIPIILSLLKVLLCSILVC